MTKSTKGTGKKSHSFWWALDRALGENLEMKIKHPSLYQLMQKPEHRQNSSESEWNKQDMEIKQKRLSETLNGLSNYKRSPGLEQLPT